MLNFRNNEKGDSHIIVEHPRHRGTSQSDRSSNKDTVQSEPPRPRHPYYDDEPVPIYDPFGREGAGAPLRDDKGTISVITRKNFLFILICKLYCVKQTILFMEA